MRSPPLSPPFPLAYDSHSPASTVPRCVSVMCDLSSSLRFKVCFAVSLSFGGIDDLVSSQSVAARARCSDTVNYFKQCCL